MTPVPTIAIRSTGLFTMGSDLSHPVHTHPTGGERAQRLDEGIGGEQSPQAPSFRALAVTGSLRTRVPVAAKMAFVTAGTTAEVPASPIPPGDSPLCTMCTSTAGASLI